MHFCDKHMAHISHIPYTIWQCEWCRFQNFLVKLHTPATPKNDHYFLRPNHHVETIVLTSESLWLTERNSWLVWGPLNTLWNRARKKKGFPETKMPDLKRLSLIETGKCLSCHLNTTNTTVLWVINVHPVDSCTVEICVVTLWFDMKTEKKCFLYGLFSPGGCGKQTISIIFHNCSF